MFLTDGLPTAGERREPQIVANAKTANKIHARIFAFGVGFDVNSRLLDKMARECFGQSEYVLPDEDIEAHVAKLYSRIGAPAMVDLKVAFDLENMSAEQGAAISRVYPKDAIDLFAGDQLVLVGRYKQPGDAKVTIRGKVDGTEQSFSFPAKLAEKSADDSQAFIEKLWAVRRVGEIIDEIDLHGKNQELVNELVSLATRHGILTPYTSFLADENANIRDVAAVQLQAGQALDNLQRETGDFAFRQRMVKSSLQRAKQASPGYAMDLSYGLAESASRDRSWNGRGVRSRRCDGWRACDARWRRCGPRHGRAGYAGYSCHRAIGGELAEGAGVATSVINVGKKTFFQRNNRWEDSVLTDEQLKNVQRIERFSDAYFALSRQYGKEVAKYLALDGKVVLVLGDQAYEF